MAEKYGMIQRTQQNTLKKNYRNYLTSSKKIWVGANVGNLGPRGPDRTKRGITQQNLENHSIRGQIRFGPNCKPFTKRAIRDNFYQKPDAQIEKSHLSQLFIFVDQQIEKKRDVYPVSFIFVWTTFKHQIPDLCAIPKFQYFLVFGVQKHISNTYFAIND